MILNNTFIISHLFDIYSALKNGILKADSKPKKHSQSQLHSIHI